jgi:hypothetical protein
MVIGGRGAKIWATLTALLPIYQIHRPNSTALFEWIWWIANPLAFCQWSGQWNPRVDPLRGLGGVAFNSGLISLG